MDTFAKRLKELRKQKKLMTKDLAKKLNVEPATITNWEKGKRVPREDMLITISDFFDCSIDYLFGRTDNPSSKIYTGKLQDENVEIEVDKNYPYDLTPEDVENILKQLEDVGLNIERLIKTSKSKRQEHNTEN